MFRKDIKLLQAAILFLSMAFITSCNNNDADDNTPQGEPVDVEEEFSIVTLNVDGLPNTIKILGTVQITINDDGPGAELTPQISRYLADHNYDFIAVQENFDFNEQLSSALKSDYNQDSWYCGIDVSKMVNARFPCDGINGFWKKDIDAKRSDSISWTTAYGKLNHAWDDIVTKGFRRYDVKLKGGSELVIYNMHMDAGDDADEFAGNDGPDRRARMVQWRQLRDYILEHLDKRPVIVVGDLNTWYARDSVKTQFIDYIAQTGRATVGDVWIELERGGVYPGIVDGIVTRDPWSKDCSRNGEVLDKILYLNPRDGAKLTPVSVNIDETDYVRSDGSTPLGDHYPLSATFRVNSTIYR